MTARTLRLTDPLAMRALAHPLRLRLLRLLRERGAATGAELATQVGESTANVSYHLSVLARHGFIEPYPVPGPTRRHKPWRASFDSITTEGADRTGPMLESPEGALLAAVLTDSRSLQDAFLSRAQTLDEPWRDVANFQHAGLALLPHEVDELGSVVREVIERFDRDRRGAQTSDQEGTRRVAVSFIVVPTIDEARRDG